MTCSSLMISFLEFNLLLFAGFMLFCKGSGQLSMRRFCQSFKTLTCATKSHNTEQLKYSKHQSFFRVSTYWTNLKNVLMKNKTKKKITWRHCWSYNVLRTFYITLSIFTNPDENMPKSLRWDQDVQPNDAINKSPTVVTSERERRVEETNKFQYLGTWSQKWTFWKSFNLSSK